jgi:hypothetical protein
MSASDDELRAVLVIVGTGQPMVVAVARTVPCDLDLVDRILWMSLLARRRGWAVRLVAVDDELAELLDLVGVAGRLGLTR